MTTRPGRALTPSRPGKINHSVMAVTAAEGPFRHAMLNTLAFAIITVALGMRFLVPLMYELELGRKLRQIAGLSSVRGNRPSRPTLGLQLTRREFKQH
jgi:hypothetical protein